MAELAIIADDLTGALDAAAPFAMRGVKTAVALSPTGLNAAIAGGARVVGVSTDSREVDADIARERVRRAVAALPSGIALFKKVDSRLKGNIAAELDAIPHKRSLVIPAIPSFGRWMREGKLGGFGVATPIDVATRLGSHADRAIIPDIAEQADIDAAIRKRHDLPVGARGLAEALAKAMAPKAAPPDTTLEAPRAYVVIGSTDPITVAQLAHLCAFNPQLAYIAAPNGVAPPQLQPPGALTVLQATPGVAPADGRTVAKGLADALVRLDPPQGSLLVLSGGATAQVILEQLGVRTLDLVGEALPGLPLAKGGGLTFVTKSGGFGDEETLQRLLLSFTAQKERSA